MHYWSYGGAALAALAAAAAAVQALVLAGVAGPVAPPVWSPLRVSLRLVTADVAASDGILLSALASAARLGDSAKRRLHAPWARGALYGAALLSLAPDVSGWMRLLGWWWLPVPVAAFPAAAAALAPEALVLSLSLWLAQLRGCGIFLGLQWNTLLLETGAGSLLALLLAPRGALAAVAPTLLLQFIALRLLVSSGIAKLVTRDGAWASLTAMAYHHMVRSRPAPMPTAHSPARSRSHALPLGASRRSPCRTLARGVRSAPRGASTSPPRSLRTHQRR